MYDLTSFSSYSQLINLLEYEYNRDDSDFPQLNISMIVDKGKGIPVIYDIIQEVLLTLQSSKTQSKR
jgi:transposase